MSDLVLWAVVALSASVQIVGLARPKQPEGPTWVMATTAVLGLPLIALWVVAGWLTGYWQLAFIPVVALVVAVTGAVAKAAK